MIKMKIIGSLFLSLLLVSSAFAKDPKMVFRKKLDGVNKRMKRNNCPDKPKNKRKCKMQLKRKGNLENCLRVPTGKVCEKILAEGKKKKGPFRNRRRRARR